MIGLNGSFISKPVTGVQRVAGGLSRKLRAALAPDILRPYVPGGTAEADARALLDGPEAMSIVQGPAWSRSVQAFEQVALPLLASGDGVESLISLTNTAVLGLPTRQAVVLYDAAPIRFPMYFHPLYRLKFRAVIAKARHSSVRVFTCSNFSRAELERLGIEVDGVIPMGVGMPVDMSCHIGERVGDCVTVGSSDPRKCVGEVVSMWGEVWRRFGLDLSVVGGASNVLRRPVDLAAAGVKYVGRLSDGDASALYQRARVAIFASVYEGTALAPLEALAHGCMVVVRDIPVFREQLGDWAFYFSDVRDIPAIVEAAMVAAERSTVQGYEALGLDDWSSGAKVIAGVLSA